MEQTQKNDSTRTSLSIEFFNATNQKVKRIRLSLAALSARWNTQIFANIPYQFIYFVILVNVIGYFDVDYIWQAASTLHVVMFFHTLHLGILNLSFCV